MNRVVHRNSSMWWRSQIKIKDDFIIPVQPVHPYDPFDYYFDDATATRYTQSLHYEFLAVPQDDLSAVASFCSLRGIPGIPSRLFDGFTSRPLYKNGGLAMMEVKHFYMVQDQLRQAINLIQTIPSTPPRTFENEVQKRVYRSPERRLEAIFEDQMHDVRLAPSWDTHRAAWMVRWSADTLTAVMYLMLLLDLQGPGCIRACPRCNSVFTAYDARTRFCSPRCQNSAKQERHRDKLKRAAIGEAKGKERSHGAKKR